ncbi:hypothetical protein ACFSCX_19600 [Bacillus salitolerans]|uniref:Uncharacterized protein n=1 Tax=Bacillus salitolerans TaxID=1437434 RepID=A0ABW4LU97_9BACI
MGKSKFVWISVIISMVLITVVLFNLSAITESYQQMKVESSEGHIKKTLDYEQLYLIEREQRVLAASPLLNEYNWISDEIIESTTNLRFNLDYLKDHPEFEEVEIEFLIKTYVVEGKEIEFIAGEGKIMKVKEAGEWRNP